MQNAKFNNQTKTEPKLQTFFIRPCKKCGSVLEIVSQIGRKSLSYLLYSIMHKKYITQIEKICNFGLIKKNYDFRFNLVNMTKKTQADSNS